MVGNGRWRGGRPGGLAVSRARRNRALEQRKTNMLPTEPGRANPTPAEAAVAAAAAAAKRAAGGGAGAQGGRRSEGNGGGGRIGGGGGDGGASQTWCQRYASGSGDAVFFGGGGGRAGEPAGETAGEGRRAEGQRCASGSRHDNNPCRAETEWVLDRAAMASERGTWTGSRTVEYLKELTVVLEVEGDGQVAVMELMRAVKMLCGGLVGCRVTGPKTFEVTLSHVKGKERVLDGFKIDGGNVDGEGVGERRTSGVVPQPPRVHN